MLKFLNALAALAAVGTFVIAFLGNPYSRWKSAFEAELEADGPQFLDYFGTNRME